MQIKLTSVLVDDQAKALTFYTEKLGFEKQRDVPVGEHRFLTVTSPDGPEGIELLLEPNANPAAQRYQRELYEQGIPAAAFFTEDLRGEHEQLVARGVDFPTPPTEAGPVSIAVLDDTCGNLIQLTQE